jgi:hypothetical protein
MCKPIQSRILQDPCYRELSSGQSNSGSKTGLPPDAVQEAHPAWTKLDLRLVEAAPAVLQFSLARNVGRLVAFRPKPAGGGIEPPTLPFSAACSAGRATSALPAQARLRAEGVFEVGTI